MKALFTLILTVLYMSSATGATFHMHYCMGKLTGVELWHGEKKACSQCGTKHNNSCKKNCCRDEHKTVKLEKDHKTSEETVHFLAMPALAASPAYAVLPAVKVATLLQEQPVSHAPPRSSKVPSRILLCTFLI